MTGEPLSEKSKVVGGLLQLLGLFGLVGIGRIYLGYTKLGVIQLVVGLLTCGIGRHRLGHRRRGPDPDRQGA